MPRPQPLMMQCCCLKSSSLLRPGPYGTASRASMRAASTFSSITKALSPSPRMPPRGRVLSADVITAQVGPPIRSATNRLLAQINRGTAGGGQHGARLRRRRILRSMQERCKFQGAGLTRRRSRTSIPSRTPFHGACTHLLSGRDPTFLLRCAKARPWASFFNRFFQ